MSVQDRPATGVGSLSDRELEVLRLLTAGHTVKSIAARLGRSEASINERLRDARRKTGIGSSRELARHVAAQKSWDKIIDLPTHPPAIDGEARSPLFGRPSSKGTIIMLIAMAFATAGLVFAAAQTTDQSAPAQTAVAEPGRPPIVGKWSLDTSRLPADERPRSVTLEFRISGDQEWTGKSEVVAADGSRQQAQATAPADGVPVPLAGNMPSVDMVSLRQPAPNTLVLTFTKDGDAVSTRVYTVENDGDSMKETIAWAGDVAPRMVTTYFTRIE